MKDDIISADADGCATVFLVNYNTSGKIDSVEKFDFENTVDIPFTGEYDYVFLWDKENLAPVCEKLDISY